MSRYGTVIVNSASRSDQGPRLENGLSADGGVIPDNGTQKGLAGGKGLHLSFYGDSDGYFTLVQPEIGRTGMTPDPHPTADQGSKKAKYPAIIKN